MFNEITVNLETGAIAYPSPEGFTLDHEQVYRTAELFTTHCDLEMAIRHAIHGQIQAFIGGAQLRRAVAS